MLEGPRGVTVLASLSPRAHVEGFEGRVMGWGLGGVSRQAGLLLLQGDRKSTRLNSSH